MVARDFVVVISTCLLAAALLERAEMSRCSHVTDS